MTYFSLRKREPEPEPESDEPDEDEQPEETEDEATEDAPERDHGPIITGLLGPGRWLTARFNLDTAIIAHLLAAFAVVYYQGGIAVGIILAWLVAVLLFIPREALERAAGVIERHHPGRREQAPADVSAATEEQEPADPRRVLIGWLDDLTRGRAGIHLDELHQALTQHPQLAALKRPEMRAWLDRHGVAVERTLRVGRIAGRSGVSRTTVEALLKALPPLAESGVPKPSVHASGLHDSPVESGVERGGEHAV